MSVSTANLLGISDSTYDAFVNDAVSVLKDGNLTFGEVLSVCGKLTSQVVLLASLSIHQKKYLVVDILQKALEKLKENAPEALSSKISQASEVVLNSVPALFDAIVGAVENKVKGLFSSLSCLPCLGSASILTSVIPPSVLSSVCPSAPSAPSAPPSAPSAPPSAPPSAKDVSPEAVALQEKDANTMDLRDVETTPVQVLPNTASE